MTDWIEHNGGPQPVGDDVWVGIVTPPCLNWWDIETMPAKEVGWGQKFEWSILNQHLIAAALKRGIELGLEAAATTVCRLEIEAARELEESGDCHCPAEGRFAGLAEATDLIRALNPDTIAREAVLDQLTSEAQADNMGYDKETTR